MEQPTITRALMDLLHITRPLASVKNVGIALLAWYLSGTTSPPPRLLLTIVALSLVFSALYAFNSLTDLRLDARIATKRQRASAIARFGAGPVLVLITVLALLGITLGFALDALFAATLVALLITGIAYSAEPFRLKERAVWDVVFGGVLTFPLRFLGSWFVVSTAAPPLLPLLGLLFGKSGGYLLYKELDREQLAAAGIRNTVTALSTPRVVGTALTLIALSVVSFSTMIYTADAGLASLGTLPKHALLFAPLSLPPIVLTTLRTLRLTRWDPRVLRTLGFGYLIFLIVVVWQSS